MRSSPWICALSALPVVLTVLPLTRTGRGYVRIWDFPRLQIAGLAMGALAAVQRVPNQAARKWLTAALGACALYQGRRICTYTPLHRKQVLDALNCSPNLRIRVLIANILMTNRQYDRLLRTIGDANADVICLVETDDEWECAMRPVEEKYTWKNKCPLGNTYGMLLYSRLPLVSTETRFLVQADIPSMRSVVKLRSGDELVLHCVHPRPPRPWTDSYARDAELVLVGKEVAADDRPALVVGDMNDVAWSYTTQLFQRLSQTLDPRVGRGLYNSFHADYIWMRYPLDHVFVSRDFTLVNLQRLPHIGSDHFPILVELAYTPRAQEMHETPEMQPTDHAEAADILQDAVEQDLRYSGDDQE